jgi:hypothetical protein
MSSTGPDDEEQKPPQWQQPQWKSGDPLDQGPTPPGEERPSWQQDQPSWQQPQQDWQSQMGQPQWQQPQDQPMWQQSQPQWGQTPQWQPGPQTPGSATAALILGICAIVVCWPICGPLAVVYGNKAKGEIARSNGNLTGGGLATAGIIMGWIGIAFTVLLVVGILFGFASSLEGGAIVARSLSA